MLSHWGRATPIVRDGRIVAMAPPADDPDPAPINDNLIDALTSPARILQAMVRRGWLAGDKGAARGEDGFVAVSWDRATTLLADAMGEIIAAHGNESIFGGSYGWASAGRFHHAQSQIHRFLNLAGTAHTTIVFVEPFEGEPPRVRAYDPPEIEGQETR